MKKGEYVPVHHDVSCSKLLLKQQDKAFLRANVKSCLQLQRHKMNITIIYADIYLMCIVYSPGTTNHP